jgi:hypothetical protein
VSSINVQPMRINLQSRHNLGVITIAQSLKLKREGSRYGNELQKLSCS